MLEAAVSSPDVNSAKDVREAAMGGARTSSGVTPSLCDTLSATSAAWGAQTNTLSDLRQTAPFPAGRA